MFSHFITYGRIAQEIREDLEGAFISSIFSTGKDELIIETRGKDGTYQLIMQWMEQEMFIRYNMPYRKYGRKCIPWFKSAENLKIVSVSQLPLERIIHIELEDKKSILLKGFGRYSNVLFYDNAICIHVFRQNLKSDLEQNIAQYVNAKLDEPSIDTLEDLKTLYPQLFGKWDTPIPNDFFTIPNSKIPHIENIFNDLSKKYLSFDKGKLGFSDLKTNTQEVISEFLKETRKTKQSAQLKSSISQKKKRFSSYLKKSSLELENLKKAKGYKEMGDLILSSLHLIEPGADSVKVWDYYDNLELQIKLNPLLNGQQNAQRFYRKGKNQHLQIEEIERKIKKAKNGIIDCEAKLLKIEKGEHIKIEKGVPKQEKQSSSPYKVVSSEEFDIWVGKNAKGNDAMLKLARKQDTWMHARGYAGSHVIIRNNGALVTNALLEKAGQYAVSNSKAKSQALVPVIYTQCKFVSKPRNATPGLVKVLQENVIDISNEFS